MLVVLVVVVVLVALVVLVVVVVVVVLVVVVSDSGVRHCDRAQCSIAASLTIPCTTPTSTAITTTPPSHSYH